MDKDSFTTEDAEDAESVPLRTPRLSSGFIAGAIEALTFRKHQSIFCAPLNSI
jgi:hypothetical protein